MERERGLCEEAPASADGFDVGAKGKVTYGGSQALQLEQCGG